MAEERNDDMGVLGKQGRRGRAGGREYVRKGERKREKGEEEREGRERESKGKKERARERKREAAGLEGEGPPVPTRSYTDGAAICTGRTLAPVLARSILNPNIQPVSKTSEHPNAKLQASKRQNVKTSKRQNVKTSKRFPCRESNPGLDGESVIS